MEVYPATPKPSFSYVLDHQFRTLITDFESGTEARNKRWRFPKRTFVIIYKVMEFIASERDAIYEFYQNRLGIHEPFWYFDFQERKWIDQKVGYGDGVEDTFDLPGNGTIIAVYIDEVATVDYSFSGGTGEGGADQIIFDSIPANKSILTADFTGYLRIQGHFKDDKLTEEITTTHLDNLSISILEIKTSGEFLKGYLRDTDEELILDINGNAIMEVA